MMRGSLNSDKGVISGLSYYQSITIFRSDESKLSRKDKEGAKAQHNNLRVKLIASLMSKRVNG